MTARFDDANLEELLGAYALDACEPGEAAAVEELLDRRPDLAAEATRLSNAAAWVGATEALAPPPTLRAAVLQAAQHHRSTRDAPARGYAAATARTEQTIAGVDEHADAPTFNGLRAHELVIHLAAQESLLAHAIGAPTEPDVTELDIDARTAAFIDRYGSRPLDDVRAAWRRAVDVVQQWADDPAAFGANVDWLGVQLPRENLLVARAFENWIHRDDLRATQGLPKDVPPSDELHEMADLSLRTLPMALLVSGRSRPDRVARIVLTGDGGGDWLVAMGGGAVPAGATADVTFTADVVEWCLVAGERMEAAALPRTVAGDESLAEDLVSAAPAFATL